MNCRICEAESKPLFIGRLLGKYDVQYFCCPKCGFVNTETPHWLEEAYQSSIAKTDVGLVHRNIHSWSETRRLISCFFTRKGKYVDYGGGTGLLVRLMRDSGFEFYWQDSYTPNQFAEGFEHNQGTKYDCLTAFELFEHLVDPVAEVKLMAEMAESIFFSTALIPTPPPSFEKWSYYAPTSGQHVSFYTKQSLDIFAERFGWKYTRLTSRLHVFSRKKLNPLLVYLVFKSPISSVIAHFCKRPSLRESDYRRAVSALSAR